MNGDARFLAVGTVLAQERTRERWSPPLLAAALGGGEESFRVKNKILDGFIAAWMDRSPRSSLSRRTRKALPPDYSVDGRSLVVKR